MQSGEISPGNFTCQTEQADWTFLVRPHRLSSSRRHRGAKLYPAISLHGSARGLVPTNFNVMSLRPSCLLSFVQ